MGAFLTREFFFFRYPRHIDSPPLQICLSVHRETSKPL